eukprot:1338517-Amorphochlora_amoeboformis.AAC.1
MGGVVMLGNTHSSAVRVSQQSRARVGVWGIGYVFFGVWVTCFIGFGAGKCGSMVGLHME